MNKSDTIVELSKAMALAQGELENADKNTTNPHYKSRYADLAEVLNTVRPVLSKHGLSVIQMPSTEGNIVSVETLLTHASGEWISSTISCPVGKLDAQGVGSAITYLRRYSLAAFAGCAQEDTDAQDVSAPTNLTKIQYNNQKPQSQMTRVEPKSEPKKPLTDEEKVVVKESHEFLIRNAETLADLQKAVNAMAVAFKGDEDIINSFKDIAKEVKAIHGW